MEINIVRLQDDHPKREPLDPTLLFNIEFVLNGKHRITIAEEDGKLHIHSSHGRLQITPRTSNAIVIEAIG